jgi:uncharacterized membrane protein YfcA
MTATAMAAIVLGTCLAGFVQGLSGFAFGLVAMSVWAWTIEPQLAGPMVVWGSWIGQILSLGSVRGWDKDAQRSVFQFFNLAMHTLTLAVYFVGGTLTAAMVPAFALMVPVAVVPTLVGVVVYRRVDERAFRRVVLGLLLASGVALVVSVAVG